MFQYETFKVITNGFNMKLMLNNGEFYRQVVTIKYQIFPLTPVQHRLSFPLLPSTIYHLLSTIYYLLSTINHLLPSASTLRFESSPLSSRISSSSAIMSLSLFLRLSPSADDSPQIYAAPRLSSRVPPVANSSANPPKFAG